MTGFHPPLEGEKESRSDRFHFQCLYTVYFLINLTYRIAGYFHVDLIFEWLARVEN